jgi:hypothetical protein
MLVLAILAFSTGAALSSVNALTFNTGTPPSPPWTSYNQLPWSYNQLVTSGVLTIQGSSTVQPIATEEATQGNFVNYWNALVNSNSALGGTSALLSTTASPNPSITGLGSGTAIPALDGSVATADVGEMSRPPSDAEWQTGALNNMQVYAIGVDSVAIVLSPDMSWFLPYLATQTYQGQTVKGLTTAQVAELFAEPSTTSGFSSTNQGIATGAAGSPALYSTWLQFFQAQGWTTPTSGTLFTEMSQTIQRVARDPTSGTYDCFNNYFAVPNGYQFEFKAVPAGEPAGSATTVQGSQEMAAFTYEEENSGVQTQISTGGDSQIGFISTGYLLTAGTSMIGIPIAFNMASPPSGSTTSPLIKYYGSSGTYSFVGDSANLPTWGTYVVPNDANVIYAYSGSQGTYNGVAATGKYEAWRWLWEVTPGPIPASGPTLAAGVWIAYMMADGTTNTGDVSAVTIPASGAPTGIGSGTSNFVADQNYIPLSRDDFTGGVVEDSNLNTYGSAQGLTSTQTQSFPNGAVGPSDFFYFVDAYINYYANGVYNPYADIYASGVINGHSFIGFVAAYIAYFTTYYPTA